MEPASNGARRRMRQFARSLACVALVGAISRLSLVAFVFPSGHVTLAKLLWLSLGLGLASVHLRCVVHWWTLHSSRFFITDENSGVSTHLDSLEDTMQLQVDTPQFQGKLTIAVRSEPIGLQLQGRITRRVPANSTVFAAVELDKNCSNVAVKVLLAVLQKLFQGTAVHIAVGDNSQGDDDNVELPHIALPMHMCANAALGGSLEAKEVQEETVTAGKVHTFQGIVDWRWKWTVKAALAILPWMPLHLERVQLVTYLLTPKRTASLETCHSAARKRYLSCYSVHRQESKRVDPKTLRVLLPHDLHVHEVDVGSPISLWSAGDQRGGGVPVAHAEACRRIAEDARALGRLAFSLDVWVEFVDRSAGRRKVAYLLEVVDMVQQRKRTVLRSATTIKNALLLLRLEHQLDRKETQSERNILEDEDEGESADVQNLIVESREYRYEQIEHETSVVAGVLEKVASKPQGRRRWRQPQSCYQHQLEKATLFRCLAAPSRLPSVATYHAIGVQMSDTDHAAMNIVYEAGIYRLHGAGETTPLLRQEWFVITAAELQFFRSYSATPALRVPITNVLTVLSVDRARLLNGVEPPDAHHEQGAVPRWYCVQIHLVLETITLFVETTKLRDEILVSMQPLTNDDCNLNVATSTAEAEAVAASPLFSSMLLDSQTQPVCLNQRISRFVTDVSKTELVRSLQLVQESLTAGLEVFALGEVVSRRRISRAAVLRFLSSVEELNRLDLDGIAKQTSHEQRFAFALNLYHTLFIHAVLVFGYPQSHEQWKLMQTVPCYLVRSGESSVRFTLADIQRLMLRCPVPVTLEALGLKRSLSQNALMDLAIGSGDAINGLCRTVLGVSWTPTFPASSSYMTPKETPLPIPAGLAIDRSDVRTSMVLQINSRPPEAKTTGVMKVYDDKLDDQLSATCTAFLRRELRLDETSRVIYLPRICEWYRMSQRDEDEDDAVSRRMGPLTQRRRRSSSGSVNGVGALPTSRSFFCLQRLLEFMEVEQHHRVMHLLLGAGDECRFVFEDFWTRPGRSAAVSLLSTAGAAALSVFTGSSTTKSNAMDFSDTASNRSTDEGSDWIQAGQQSLRSYF